MITEVNVVEPSLGSQVGGAVQSVGDKPVAVKNDTDANPVSPPYAYVATTT